MSSFSVQFQSMLAILVCGAACSTLTPQCVRITMHTASSSSRIRIKLDYCRIVFTPYNNSCNILTLIPLFLATVAPLWSIITHQALNLYSERVYVSGRLGSTRPITGRGPCPWVGCIGAHAQSGPFATLDSGLHAIKGPLAWTEVLDSFHVEV